MSSVAKVLDDVPSEECERRTKIDIIFEKVVSHVDAEIKVCPRCEMQNKGRFPEDMKGPLQYGPGIKGYVVNPWLPKWSLSSGCNRWFRP